MTAPFVARTFALRLSNVQALYCELVVISMELVQVVSPGSMHNGPFASVAQAAKLLSAVVLCALRP